MRTIAITNQKGGVGKTTTAVNLGHALALAGKRVLLLDLDPQAHLSACLGMASGHPGLDEVLLGKRPLQKVIQAARDNLDLAPAGPRLQEVEQLTKGGAGRGNLLTKAIEAIREQYDFILADCPPAAALLTCNALFACREVLFPVPGDFLSLQAFSQSLKTLKAVEQRLQRRYRKWLALTRFHPRRRLAREIHASLHQRFPNAVMGTAINECAALAEAPSLGKTAFEFPGARRSADDYRELAQEILEKGAP